MVGKRGRMSTVTKQQLLVNETKNEYEYDRAKALDVWHWIQANFPGCAGYADYAALTDDDRIIYLFELLNESQFGDVIFPDLANFSQGSTLIERGEDE